MTLLPAPLLAGSLISPTSLVGATLKTLPNKNMYMYDQRDLEVFGTRELIERVLMLQKTLQEVQTKIAEIY